MKRTIMLFASILLFILTYGQSGHLQIPQFEEEVFINGNQEKLSYRLLYPMHYQWNKKYPLVLFLHGAGSQGNDNERQLEEVPKLFLNAASSKKQACFVLAPQCPKNDAWACFPQYPLCSTTKETTRASRLTLELIDSLVSSLRIDRQRIYVTGLSLGGEGTFDIITRRPHFFAAAIPVCGIADTCKIDLMKSTPLWIFHGDSDDINPVDYSRNMVNALRKKGVSPIYTEYKGVKHDSWTKAYQEPELLNWMFKQKLTNAQVKNPILPGFYPDPSICRVDNDYYLVSSSFSFFPGVPIFHSTDLVNWTQIGHVLDRPSQLKLKNHWLSGGIYAPAIRFHNGTFYMVTTLIGDEGGNFFVTAKNPAGPWSEPNWLKEIDGIDPSFFFDENGKAYIVNNGPPPSNNPLYKGHRAIWLQEFDLKTQKLVGDRKIIVNGGTDLAQKPIWIEGPHIFQNKGFYFLMAAEGGIETNHSEVIFRSKNIWGPYEVATCNPILTQRDLPANRPNPITCAGHADMVQTQSGDWVAIFLACQPYQGDFFNTGRQTYFHPVNWTGEWPIILEKNTAIPTEVKSPLEADSGKISFSDYSANWKDDFDQPDLKYEWNFIRTPQEKWYELKNNSLIIQARQVNISEVGNPSFIGRRLQFDNSEFTSSLKLEKGKEMEAGIVVFQNEKFYYKLVIQQVSSKNYLLVASASGEIQKTEIEGYKHGKQVYLRMKMRVGDFVCEYSLNNKTWIQFGQTLDGKLLSTRVAGGCVGAYFGLYAYSKTPAVSIFDWVTCQKLTN